MTEIDRDFSNTLLIAAFAMLFGLVMGYAAHATSTPRADATPEACACLFAQSDTLDVLREHRRCVRFIEGPR